MFEKANRKAKAALEARQAKVAEAERHRAIMRAKAKEKSTSKSLFRIFGVDLRRFELTRVSQGLMGATRSVRPTPT